MTGWRLGYAVLPTAEEAAVFKQWNINTISCVPPFIQEAGRVALASDESHHYVQRMVSEFESRRDWIVSELNQIGGIRCQNPKGAFYVFPNIAGACERLGVIDAYDSLDPQVRARTSPSELFQRFLLYRHGVATIGRESFGRIGAEGQHFLRLSIATSRERLAEGVVRIRTAVADREGFASFLEEGSAERLTLWQRRDICRLPPSDRRVFRRSIARLEARSPL